MAIQVKGSGSDRRVAMWEKSPSHPQGEAFVTNDGRTHMVGKTPLVERLLKEGRLVQVNTRQTPVQGTQETPVDGLAGLGLTAEQIQALTEAGFGDRQALAAASDDDLDAVPGIGKATIANLRKALGESR